MTPPRTPASPASPASPELVTDHAASRVAVIRDATTHEARFVLLPLDDWASAPALRAFADALLDEDVAAAMDVLDLARQVEYRVRADYERALASARAYAIALARACETE